MCALYTHVQMAIASEIHGDAAPENFLQGVCWPGMVKDWYMEGGECVVP